MKVYNYSSKPVETLVGTIKTVGRPLRLKVGEVTRQIGTELGRKVEAASANYEQLEDAIDMDHFMMLLTEIRTSEDALMIVVDAEIAPILEAQYNYLSGQANAYHQLWEEMFGSDLNKRLRNLLVQMEEKVATMHMMVEIMGQIVWADPASPTGWRSLSHRS